MSSTNNDEIGDKDVDNDLLYGQPIPERLENRAKFGRQFFAALSPVIGNNSLGLCNGFTAVLIPKIKDIVDLEEGSWLAGTVVLSMLVGNILSSFIMRYFGRKFTLIFSYVPSIIGWIYISFATNFSTLLLSCLFIGFGSGIITSVGLVYYAEICEPKLRGLFLGLIVSSVSSGILLIHCLEIWLDWRLASQIASAVPLVGFILSFFVPESPAWLLSKRQIEKASNNFFWLRGFDEASRTEFNALVNRQLKNNTKSNWQDVPRSLISKEFLRPFAILLVLFSVQQWSGLNVIIFHAVMLLQKVVPRINPNGCTILIDILRLASTIVCCYLIKILPRRVLFFTSAVGTLVSMVGVIVASVYDLNPVFTIITLCCYIGALHLGVVMVPWLMNSELYPITIRDAGIVITTVYANFLLFILVKTSPSMMVNLGVSNTMSIYTAIMFVGSVVLYFILPETKDTTLQEAGDKLGETEKA